MTKKTLAIKIPEGVQVELSALTAKIVGPKGSVEIKIPQSIIVEKGTSGITVLPRGEGKTYKAIAGTIKSLLNNAFLGVIQEWKKGLEINGTGYRVELIDKNLSIKIGYSHPVIFQPPAGVVFEVQDNKITVLGVNKELVGNIAAKIRKTKKLDPYKGKGIKYLGEYIKLKPGKAAKTGAAGG